MLLHIALHHIFRLVAAASLHKERLRGLQNLIRNGDNLVNVHVACNGKHHIVKIIKLIIAFVKQLRGYMGN